MKGISFASTKIARLPAGGIKADTVKNSELKLITPNDLFQ